MRLRLLLGFIAAGAGCSAQPITGTVSTNPNTQQGANDSTTCPGDANDTLAPLRQGCLAQINNYRATLHLAPLGRWCGKAACVDNQASQDANANKAHSAFGQCGESAQDECPGWPLPEAYSISSCLAQMWAEGPGTDYATHGHYINMSNPNYTQGECGFYQSASGTFWGAQDFH